MRTVGGGGAKPPRGPAPEATGGAGKGHINQGGVQLGALTRDDSQASRSLAEAFAQHPRDASAALADVRASWWRLRRAGVGLPAQPGVIALAGGRQ